MGAWGHDVFENDSAVDWVYELEEQGAALISTTLESVLQAGGDFLDADIASEGLAAAEALARLLGRPGQTDPYTESLDAWIASNRFEPSPNLIKAAVASLDLVLGANSELAELWAEEEESLGRWRSAVEGLRLRLVPAD